MSGPTQTAAQRQSEHSVWRAHPRLARLVRVLIFVLPVMASFLFSWTAARVFPPERLGLGLWPWWVALVVVSVAAMRLLRRLAQKAAPLAVMLQMTLIFPDEAPSRMRTALRSGNSKAMLRKLDAGESPASDASAPATEVLLGLLSELNSHDPLTRGHSERVRAYTDLIAEQLELDELAAAKLRWGALLHDLGKLEVPTEILQGTGRPTDAEWEILKTHPEHSGRMLEPLKPWLGEWALAGEQHHLRWDGNGYPSTLAGTDISLAGRIVAVADAYDVMTSVRSYKKGLSPEIARTELADCAGTQFDPAVVRAFLAVGIGRLRAVLGPMGWLAGVLDALRLPFAPAAVAKAAAAAVSATVVAAGVSIGAMSEPAPEVADPPAAAREVTAEPTLATVETTEDAAVSFSIEVDVGEAATTWSIGTPGNGTLVVVDGDNGELRYIPDDDFSGADQVIVEFCVDGVCRETVIDIVVTPVNDPPVVADDEATGDAGTELVVDVLDNDVDVDGDVLTVVIPTPPEFGTATTDGTSIFYLPDDSFVGTVTIEYVVVDASGGRASASLVITIGNPVPPDAQPDAATVLEDGSVEISVLDNDVPGTAPLGSDVELVTFPSRGSVVVAGNGTIAYEPSANAVGTDAFTYRVADEYGEISAPTTVIVTIQPVNDAPSFVPGASSIVAHAGGSPVHASWASGISAGPPDEAAQVLTFSAVVDRPELFAGPPTLDPATGNLRFTPAAAGSGTANVMAVLRDNGGVAFGGSDASAASLFVIRINERPFAAADSAAVFEDVPVAIDVLANDTDTEDGVPLGAVVASGATKGVVSVGTDRQITYTPNAGANGIDTFTYAVMDSDGALSAPATVTVLVAPVNDAPTFSHAGDPTAVPEDSGLRTVAGWATSLSAGPPDESSQTVAFSVVSNSNPGLFAVAPAVSATGDLTYTPAADANGSAAVTVQLSDDGGTANGGDDTSDPVTITIAVSAVNDAPSFAGGTDPTGLFEGDGAVSVAGWATAMSAGPADESGQTLTFTTVANSNPGLFSVAPELDEATGDLTFTLGADASGVANVSFRLVDDGGTANGGVDASAAVSVQITVAGVNDAPTWTDAGDPASVLEDAGAQTVAGWASAIDAGAPDESGQVLTFGLDSNSNPGLFLVAPAIDASTGNLTFTPAADANGGADLAFTLSDDGGTANGGVDTSTTHTLSITVTPVNDEPTFTAGAAVTVAQDSGTYSAIGWATAISKGPADESGQTLTFTETPSVPGLFSTGPKVDEVTGELTFTPAAGMSGVSDVDITLGDDGGTANGGDDTSPTATITITVTAAPDDFDAIAAGSDNCPTVFNVDQFDTDGDGTGDACDASPTVASTGTFTDTGQALGSAPSREVALGDVDGDGDLDAVVANYAAQNALWLNDGVGGFADSGQALGGGQAQATALGDLDGDGDLDIVWGVDGSNKVWFNDGSGTFTGSGQTLGTADTTEVALGDVDADGDLDLVATNDGAADKVWSNDGVGTFTDSGQSLGAAAGKGLALGDIDGDADLDLVVANGGVGSTVWVNDGAGGFTDSGQSLNPSRNDSDAELTDVDGDGDLDAVFAADTDANTVWRNNGAGVFTDSGQTMGSANDRGLDVGDVDGDGDIDLVFADDTGGNTVYWNDGSGLFSDSGQVLGTGTSESVGLGDLDGDGDLDLLTANNGQPNRVHLNQPRVLVSEFRTDGPGGGDDEFIEIFNAEGVDIDLDGWVLRHTGVLNIDFFSFPSVVLAPGQHFLVAHTNSPLAATADDTWSGLDYAASWGDIVLTDAGTGFVDIVGWDGGSNPILWEGTKLPSYPGAGADRSYERLTGGGSGNCTDTDDNLADWVLTGAATPRTSTDPNIPC